MTEGQQYPPTDPTSTSNTQPPPPPPSNQYHPPKSHYGPVFTSSQCPPHPGLAYSCEIPFGFLITPMSPSPHHPPNHHHHPTTTHMMEQHDEDPPIVCIKCLTYLNMYAPYDANAGLWTCPLCHTLNAAPPSLLGALNTNNHNNAQQHATLSPALISPVAEYRRSTTLSQHGNYYDKSSSSSNKCFVFVVDGNLPAEEFNAVNDGIADLYKSGVVGDEDLVGLIVFTGTVSVYQVGLSGIASCDIFPLLDSHNNNDQYHDYDYDHTNDQKDKSVSSLLGIHHITNRAYLAPAASGGMQTLLASITAAAGPILSTKPTNANSSSSSSSSGGAMSRREILRLRRERRMNNNGTTNSTTNPNNNNPSSYYRRRDKPQGQQKRCTGDAIRYAIQLASAAQKCTTSRIVLFTNGCPNTGSGSVVMETHISSIEEEESFLPFPPSSYSTKNNLYKSQVDPSKLQKSKRSLKQTATRAFDQHGIGIDVFCSGSTSLGMPALQALVEPSGGYALPHHSFVGEDRFRFNLQRVMEGTQMSRVNMDDDSLYKMNGCVLDMKMSSFIDPTHVVGPAINIIDNDSEDTISILPCERPSYSTSASLAASRDIPTSNLPSTSTLSSTLTRIKIGRFDPAATFSVMLQVNSELLLEDNGEHNNKPKHAFFQFVIRWIEHHTTLVTRVYSHRLSVANTVHDFLNGIDEEVVPVMLAKEAVLRSMVDYENNADLEEDDLDVLDDGAALLQDSLEENEELACAARCDLDATIHCISRAYRLLNQQQQQQQTTTNIPTSPTSNTHSSIGGFAFPPELSDALHLLHHLRRGTLLGPPLQSVDDRASLRGLFLRLSLEDCLSMMAPKLWSTRVDINTCRMIGPLEPVPPETLALWDDVIIVADHFDHLFVWSGKSLMDSKFDGVRDECKSWLLANTHSTTTRHRFPAIQLHTLNEGESMSRKLTSRLAPSHADPMEQQLAHFAALTQLSQEELARLRDKFRFYDDVSDPSFRRWFWGVASASSKVAMEGTSLCL